MKQVYSWLTSSRTPAAMTLAWGAKARGRRCHPGPVFFRPLRVKGFLCALTGRAAFLFRGNARTSEKFSRQPSVVLAHPREVVPPVPVRGERGLRRRREHA